jgi:hypothetical protein
MAFADITLNDGQGTPVAHTFTVVSNSGGRVVRLDLTATPEAPLAMTHAHSERKKGALAEKSHLFRIDKTVLDADGVTPYKANIRLMADMPDRIYSDALADDLAAYIRNWASSDNVRAWLRGSVG